MNDVAEPPVSPCGRNKSTLDPVTGVQMDGARLDSLWPREALAWLSAYHYVPLVVPTG